MPICGRGLRIDYSLLKATPSPRLEANLRQVHFMLAHASSIARYSVVQEGEANSLLTMIGSVPVFLISHVPKTAAMALWCTLVVS
jgi:hypothetical protein